MQELLSKVDRLENQAKYFDESLDNQSDVVL